MPDVRDKGMVGYVMDSHRRDLPPVPTPVHTFLPSLAPDRTEKFSYTQSSGGLACLAQKRLPPGWNLRQEG